MPHSSTGDEQSKKRPRKSEGPSKSKTNPASEENESKFEAADETMETNVDESLLEGKTAFMSKRDVA